MGKGKFTVVMSSEKVCKKTFKTYWKALVWCYDDVVDRDNSDLSYYIYKNGKAIGEDVSVDFCWE